MLSKRLAEVQAIAKAVESFLFSLCNCPQSIYLCYKLFGRRRFQSRPSLSSKTLAASFRHTRMKILYITTILFFSSFFARGQQPLTAQIKEYELTLRKLMIAEKPSGTIIKVEATLINNTADTLFYFSMTCSWQQFYNIDNKTFNIHNDPCDKNVQTVIAVPPKGQRSVVLDILTQNKLTTNPIGVKIGFDLVKAKNLADHRDFDKFNRKTTIIWSDKLLLK
jgi:hypothetical protein